MASTAQAFLRVRGSPTWNPRSCASLETGIFAGSLLAGSYDQSADIPNIRCQSGHFVRASLIRPFLRPQFSAQHSSPLLIDLSRHAPMSGSKTHSAAGVGSPFSRASLARRGLVSADAATATEERRPRWAGRAKSVIRPGGAGALFAAGGRHCSRSMRGATAPEHGEAHFFR